MPTESASAVAYRRSTRTRDLEAAIATLAEQQYGVVSRRQLGECGLRESAIDRRLRAGRLHQLHPGVYAVGHRLIPRQGRRMAAVLASGPDAVLSHWSTRAAFREDRARDRRLIAAGYTVAHITWAQLDDEPEEVAADLRRLLLG